MGLKRWIGKVSCLNVGIQFSAWVERQKDILGTDLPIQSAKTLAELFRQFKLTIGSFERNGVCHNDKYCIKCNGNRDNKDIMSSRKQFLGLTKIPQAEDYNKDSSVSECYKKNLQLICLRRDLISGHSALQGSPFSSEAMCASRHVS